MEHEILGPGYSVTILGRAGLRYREGERTAYVDGEVAIGKKYDYIVYARTIYQWEGTKVRIDAAKRKEISAAIAHAFEQIGQKAFIIT